MHTNQNYVFNIDLKDFFPSIDQARVWKRLQLAPFNFNAQIASVIAGFCSIKMVHHNYDESVTNFVLPQGAPTSPLLTNAVCDTLDRRLHGLAKRFGLHYSRYADDITFSSMHNVYQPESIFRKELERIITDQHFTINENKTRLNHCSKRQEVTGLTVGAKINVSRKYVKDIRAILHIWEKYGLNAAYATFFPRYKSEKCHLHDGEVNLVNVISGKLCFLKMVKGKKDPVYTKLNEHFLRLSQDSMESERQKISDIFLRRQKTTLKRNLGLLSNLHHANMITKHTVLSISKTAISSLESVKILILRIFLTTLRFLWYKRFGIPTFIVQLHIEHTCSIYCTNHFADIRPKSKNPIQISFLLNLKNLSSISPIHTRDLA